MDNDPKIPKWLLAAILAVAVTVACITNADAAETSRAPVVRPADDGVMLQTGWYTYAKLDRAIVLYCVEQKDKLLTCAVYAYPAQNVAGIALVHNVIPSETSS